MPGIEDFLVTDDGHVLCQRLGYQHPVERIPLIARQQTRSLAMLNRNMKLVESETVETLRKIRHKSIRFGQSPAPDLRCHFPGGRSTNENISAERGNYLRRFSGESRIPIHRPEQYVSVEQYSQRFLLPLRFKFIIRQRIEKGIGHFEFALPQSDWPFLRRRFHRRQPHHRFLAARDDNFFATLDFGDQL